MKAVRIVAFGATRKSLQLIEVSDLPNPGRGEVQVGMRFSPVNLNDLQLITGKFPYRPSLPANAGNEGIAEVLAVGEGVKHLKVGDHVVPPLYGGTWVERLNFLAEGVLPLPDGDLRQLAMLRINPPTAALMLSEYVDLRPGDWIIQNAGNSGVGRSVIALAKNRGLRTISLVRRPELIRELEAAGGDVVAPDTAATIAALAHSEGNVRLALDGISGDATARLAEALSTNGTLVGYAQLAGIPAPGDLRPLMRKGTSLYSFYQNRPEYAPKLSAILLEAASLIAKGKLNVPIAATFAARDYELAVDHARAGGKVMLDLRPWQWN